jgi:hypothetical protein
MSKLSVVSRDVLEEMYHNAKQKITELAQLLDLADDMYIDIQKRLDEVEHRNSLLRAELLLARARYTLGDTQ